MRFLLFCQLTFAVSRCWIFLAFSGHSLWRWPPPHRRQRGGCLQFAQTWPNGWQLWHCVSPDCDL
jgi:hypothetical protein